MDRYDDRNQYGGILMNIKVTKFEWIKDFYDEGLWTLDMVRMAVVKEWITAEDFFLITSQEYNTTE